MKNFTKHSQRVLTGVITTAAAGFLPLAGVIDAGPPAPEVPEELDGPDGHKVFLVGHAIGDQVYACTATSTGFDWTFVGPRADLYGGNDALIATHFGGPTWQARDGSAVVARREDGVTVDAAAIPWLLLSTTATSAGADGNRLTATTFIQRTHTTGGLSPAAADCNATTAGSIANVPYTADYHFWKATGG